MYTTYINMLTNVRTYTTYLNKIKGAILFLGIYLKFSCFLTYYLNFATKYCGL